MTRRPLTPIAGAMLLLVIAFALGASLATPVRAQDNTAIAINTKDGTDIFKLAFKIVRANQDIVDQSNAAVAFNSCQECQSIAVAFQIVLIFSDPDVVSSQNLALAMNVECDACVAFASAYQWLLTTGGPVHFTAEGNQRLAELRKQLKDLLQSDYTLEELVAELEWIEQEIANILANELVAAGLKPEETDEEANATTTEGTTTAPPGTTTAPPDTTTAPVTTTEGSTTTTP
jgi:putative peptide zinc metalloprotease protein